MDTLPRIALIVAAAENGVIGCDGGMPWRLSTDLKRFRGLSQGRPVVMGRKTFQSLPKPLEGRTNIVVTRSPDFAAPPGVVVTSSLPAAIAAGGRAALATGADEILVIGGGEIYAAALPLANRIYLTRVHGEPSGDTTFPALDAAQWAESRREDVPAGPKDSFATTFIVLERRAGQAAVKK